MSKRNVSIGIERLEWSRDACLANEAGRRERGETDQADADRDNAKALDDAIQVLQEYNTSTEAT